MTRELGKKNKKNIKDAKEGAELDAEENWGSALPLLWDARPQACLHPTLALYLTHEGGTPLQRL